MQSQQFLAQVRKRAHLDATADAQRISQVTLETLRDRLAGGEPKDVASQLPDELAQYLNIPGAESAERFSLAEFFQRVGQRAGVDPETAASQARTVVEVLCEAITPELIDHMRSQLPPEFHELFAAQASRAQTAEQPEHPSQAEGDEQTIDEDLRDKAPQAQRSGTSTPRQQPATSVEQHPSQVEGDEQTIDEDLRQKEAGA